MTENLEYARQFHKMNLCNF